MTDRRVAFATANRKHQPTRLDSFQLGNTTDINLSPVSTWEQLYWAWVYKAEWNSILSDKTFVEVRGGHIEASEVDRDVFYGAIASFLSLSATPLLSR